MPRYAKRSLLCSAVVILLLVSSQVLAAPFCVVTANGGTQCNYLYAESCQRAAAQYGGMCVANPNR